MRKLFTLLLIFSILFICCSICKANFSVQPREISIKMIDELIIGNTSKSVIITNNLDESINVSWYLDHPTQDLIRENKTLIPSLFWISLEPKWQIIPTKSNALFYIYLNIPEEKENFNQHWETWPVFKQEENQFFNWEHALRLYIDTPDIFSKEKNEDQNFFSNITENSFIIFIIFIICIAVLISLFIIRINKNRNKKSK